MLVGLARVSAVEDAHHGIASPPAAACPMPPAAARPRPKQPEVLVTTATTGDGIPELLAALDRHRTDGRDTVGAEARRRRAEAQVWAIVADRVRARLNAGDSAAATDAVLDAVAEHRLDPYAAADRLLEEGRLQA
jgi:LAO/AO transport system kinase